MRQIALSAWGLIRRLADDLWRHVALPLLGASAARWLRIGGTITLLEVLDEMGVNIPIFSPLSELIEVYTRYLRSIT